jgi:hypothetical protein
MIDLFNPRVALREVVENELHTPMETFLSDDEWIKQAAREAKFEKHVINCQQIKGALAGQK